MVFDLFSSKKNIQNIRDTISETIEHEFHFKIGLRYDPLIESKVKEVMTKVSDQVPEGKSVKDYILMMNKKVISLVLPTIRANALKEKSRSHLPETNRKMPSHVLDDPQDLLKRGNTRLVPEPVDAQFNLPMENMRERTLPDYPRPMPKMESSKESTNTNTLDMFNQLRSVYQAEQKASGIHDHVNGSFSEGKEEKREETFVEAHNHNHNRKIVLRKQKMETPIEPEPIPEKVMEMITPLTPLPPFSSPLLLPSQSSEKERNVDSLVMSQQIAADRMSAKRNVVRRIHYSSNYRSFMFHHSPSMFRIYLTPYFDNLYDPFVYFQLPEYTTASGAILHSAFQLQYDMKHHPHIPNIKNVKNIYIDHVKLYDGHRREESIYAELIPSLHDEPNIYHNHAHLGHDILLYNPQSGAFCAEHANRNIKEEALKTIQKNGYIQVNLYNMYHDYIHYDQDVAFIEKIEQKDGKTLLFLRGSIFEPGEKIYIYSLCHDHHRYVEFGERVFANTAELVNAEKKYFSFSAMYMDEKEGKEEMVSFEEVFEKHREHLEDLSHKSISDLFYFVIQQVNDEKRIYYDCQIVGFNREDGSVILYHKEFDRILANFENTEQFGFILKNLNGLQSDDRSDLHRKHGFVVEKVIEPNTLVLDYQGAIDANFSEGFIRHHNLQIDIQCVLEF